MPGRPVVCLLHTRTRAPSSSSSGMPHSATATSAEGDDDVLHGDDSNKCEGFSILAQLSLDSPNGTITGASSNQDCLAASEALNAAQEECERESGNTHAECRTFSSHNLPGDAECASPGKLS